MVSFAENQWKKAKKICYICTKKVRWWQEYGADLDEATLIPQFYHPKCKDNKDGGAIIKLTR